MGRSRRLQGRSLSSKPGARAALVIACVVAGCFHGVPIDGDGEVASEASGDLSTGSTSTSGEATSTGDTDVTTTTTTSTTTTSTSTSTTTTGDASTSTGDATTGVDEGECPRVRVDVPPGEDVNVRPDPSTQNPPLGTLPAGAIVDVVALVDGELLEGNAKWYQIDDGDGLAGFVWSGLVLCTLDEPPELGPPTGFFLPLECGTTTKVTQGNFGDFSHQGNSAYAFDFALGLGTPLVAIADGEVVYVYDKTKPGDPCYDGGDASCSGQTNLVTLRHGDDTTSIYAHLSEVQVSIGEFVPRGAAVGLSGSTGYSTGRHAHVARQENCGGGFCQSIAVAFEDVPGDGVPATGDTVTSMNCP